MAETRVDLLHLLEDLRDAYPGGLEESILTELIANALDSGARTVAIHADASARALTVADDGRGMKRRDLARYHDIAASTKTRGEGIGFAGVGVKLGLLAAEEVITETRRGKVHAATSWHLASRHRAPWRRVVPPGHVVAEHGTAVRLRLQNPLSPLLDPGFIEAALQRVFPALLDESFAAVLAEHYPGGVRFVVNGRAVSDRPLAGERTPIAIRIGRRRRPSAVGYLVKSAAPIPEGRRGLGVSTLGKLIRGGWDWVGLAPAAPEHVAGLIEVPALAECLTLNKSDFIRVGRRGVTYLAFRKAIQEAVAAELGAWGDVRGLADEARRKRARPLERDLSGVLLALADEFPMLASLVERRPGGQRALAAGPPPGPAPTGAPVEAIADVGEAPRALEPAPPAPAAAGEPETPGEPAASATPPSAADEAVSLPSPAVGSSPGTGEEGGRPRRSGHYGLSIQFTSAVEDGEMARLIESTVWVNEAHPAYRRAAASRSEGYHLALAVGMALAPLAVEPKDVHGFVTTFLARWGEALDRPRRRRRR